MSKAPKAKAPRTSIAKDSKTSARKTKTPVENKKSEENKVAPRPRVGQYPDDAKIAVLEKGKENPRRKDSGPFKRYAAILQSKTVGDFLEKMPRRTDTLRRAEKEGYIEIIKK